MIKMKAARLYGPKDLRIMRIPISRVGPSDVLCRVERVGICGTDYSIYSGEFSFVKNGSVKFPKTLGHEWSGTVAEAGKTVSSFKPGDRVVGDTGVACGHCNFCLSGEYNRCPQSTAVGTIHDRDGAYAEYIVMPERHLFRLPDSVSFDQGAFVEPAATALYSVRRADVGIGDTVLIHGTGPLGILAGKLAKLSGASKVFISGRRKFKLNAALSNGSDIAINTTEQNTSEIIMDHTGARGVDRIIETSGSTQLFTESFDYIRTGGTMSVVAFYDKKVEQFDIDKFVFANVTVRAVAGSLHMYPPVIDLMSSGLLQIDQLITGRYMLDDVEQALIDMKEKNSKRIKWIIDVK